ncbi:FxDxF family PEP-CTERM protein [Janthinobacterium sp.]|uniref:FxDxF family PEP-CTERM protein n=1 Tax=Janthinobacterium sp. TaxID=1871054 RepID=UPI00293D2068|nr:FxDxF family PEP-CTERM protein [Janthinobacterium sp.]
MKKITQSLFLALLFASNSLFAAPVNVSNTDVDITQSLLDASSAQLGHSFVLDAAVQSGVAGNFFSDHYTFSLGETTDLLSQITSLKTGPNSGLTLTGFDLRDAHGIVFHGIQNVTDFLPGDQAWSFTSGLSPLAAGQYFIEVNGFVAARNGSYSGNVDVAAAVPEPETYAMLLAGFAVVGFAVRRRKAAAAV